MKQYIKAWVVGTAIALFATPAAADMHYEAHDEHIELPSPLVLQDMSSQEKVDLLFAILPGDDYVAFVPRIGLHGGHFIERNNVHLSYGVVVPMSTLFLDDPLAGSTEDSEFVLGNLTADLKATKCVGDGMLTWCGGAALAAGFGFVDVASPIELATYSVGLSAAQDPVYYLSETAVIRPLLVTQLLSRHGFVLQGEVGPAVGIPLRDTTGRDTEVFIMWGAGLGYDIMGVLLPMIEGRGIHGTTSGVDGYEAYWVNVGARLMMGVLTPMLRLGVPLNDDAKVNDSHDIQVELGLSARF